MQRSLGRWNRSKPRGRNMCALANAAQGLCPSPVLQHHEIFRLLDAAHPLLSPSARILLSLHHLWLSSFLFLEIGRAGKSRLEAITVFLILWTRRQSKPHPSERGYTLSGLRSKGRGGSGPRKGSFCFP